jgi:hypothetical protein
MLYYGNTKIKNMYYGGTRITQAFYNGSRVFGGKFIAGVSGGEIGRGKFSHSDDGINWEMYSGNVAAFTKGFAFGNGKYVTIDYLARVYYSTDGLNWTAGTQFSADYGGMWKIIFSNGKFIALFSQKIISSTDGINWVTSTYTPAGSGNIFVDIAFGNGKFVVTLYNNSIIYSTDAITWNLCLANNANYAYPFIAYGNGRFVTTYNGKLAYYSTDGLIWTPIQNNIVIGNNRILFANGKFIVGGTANIINYSADGISWGSSTFSNSYENVGWLLAAYGNGRFVMIDTNHPYVTTSVDGINWTPIVKIPINTDYGNFCALSFC